MIQIKGQLFLLVYMLEVKANLLPRTKHSFKVVFFFFEKYQLTTSALVEDLETLEKQGL